MFSLRYRRPPPSSSLSSPSSFGGQQQQGSPTHIKSPFYYDEEYDSKLKKPNATRSNYLTTTITNEYVGLTTIIFFALVLRLWSIDSPQAVVATELEICSQINWYMEKKFFIGAFPPLSGLFYTSLAWYFGYTGGEQIYYAGQLTSRFPLHELRTTSAVLGSLLVPTVYITVRLLGHGRPAATTAAGLLILENGLITQSKFLMPEGLLCLFCSLTALTWARQLRRQEKEPFAITYALQVTTGLLLGCALSIKWQGIIPLGAVWTSTLAYLWKILGEKRFTFNYIAKQLSVRFITTAVLPAFVYFMLFQLHLDLIPNAGDHDLVISPRLRYSLEGNEFVQTQQDVAYGSSVIIRHTGTNGGYLHSHLKRYEAGSTQQSVSVYPYEDMNNVWVIHKSGERWNKTQPVEYVKNNDRVILEHHATFRKLHSHDHRPPVSNKKEQNEVSAYGDPHIVDPNDYWWVQIIRDDGESDGVDKTPIKAINTRIRLLHSRICHLLSHNILLPDAENPQQEVICMQGASKDLSTWIIEHTFHEELEDEEKVGYTKMTRLEMIKEIHEHMLGYSSVVHDRLAPTPPADPKYQLELLKRQKINPLGWFFGSTAYRIWDQVAGRSVYLAMNPAAKMMTFISLGIVSTYIALGMVLHKRQIKWPQALSFESTGQKWTGYDPVATRELYCQSVTFFCTAALIQALALFLMPTFNLKLADSLPSAYFSAGLIAIVLDAVTLRMGKKAQCYACFTVLLLAGYGFIRLYPVSYGDYSMSQAGCKSITGINFECNRFPERPTLTQTSMDDKESKVQDQAVATVYVEMPRKAEPYRYHVGYEADADKKIAAMQSVSFSQAYQEATGSARYHRVESTPGPAEDEVVAWQKEIFAQARERARKQKEAAEEKKRLEEESKNKMEDEQIMDQHVGNGSAEEEEQK